MRLSLLPMMPKGNWIMFARLHAIADSLIDLITHAIAGDDPMGDDLDEYYDAKLW